MARGLTREQLGITEALIATYGEAIFCMSHNHQVRRGDPVRALDWNEIERQREAMGLADGEIAERLGLTREQMMFIRNTEESRRFHPTCWTLAAENGFVPSALFPLRTVFASATTRFGCAQRCVSRECALHDRD